MAEPVYEMLWDCPRCGTEKLLGLSHRHCPSCGAPQDPSTRYFPSDEDKIAVEDHVFHGRDLNCANCESPNSAAAKHCVNCGAPMGDDDAAVGLVDVQEEAPEPPPPPRRRGCGVLGAAGLALLALVVVGVVVTCFWTRQETLEVAGHAWARQVEVERYARVDDSAWCDGMPSGAMSVRRSEKKRSTKKIADGEDCRVVKKDQGDGTFTEITECTPRYREEPVYDAWCEYEVEKWVHDHWETAEGSGLTPAPAWPTVDIGPCSRSRVGCTRVGSRKESYVVRLRGPDGALEECEVPQPRWSGMAPGSRWKGDVRVLTGGVACDSLEPA